MMFIHSVTTCQPGLSLLLSDGNLEDRTVNIMLTFTG